MTAPSSSSSKLFIENGLPFAVYLVLNAADRTLNIFVCKDDPGGGQRVEPGKSAVYDRSDLPKSCFRRGRSLEYAVVNKTGISLAFDGGRERTKEGPILRLTDGRN